METYSHKTEITNSAGKTYAYSFEDISISCGFMYKCIVNPLLKIIPMSVKPNTITLLSGLFSFSAFSIILQASFDKYHAWWAIPVLFFMYIASDYIDGEQARRTQLYSPVGEFLDHFFDSLVTGYLMAGVILTYKINNPIFVTIIMCFSYFIQATAFWERYKNGKLFFTRFSSTETVMLFSFLVFAGGFEKVRVFAAKIILSTPVGNFSSIQIFLAAMILLSIANIACTLVRTNGASFKFWSYILISLGSGLFIAFSDFHIVAKVIFIALYNVLYMVKLLTAITMKTKDPWPDFPFIAVAATIFIFTEHRHIRMSACFIYLIFSIMMKVFNLIFIYINDWQQKSISGIIGELSANFNNIKHNKNQNKEQENSPDDSKD